MIIASQSHFNIDISSQMSVLTYNYSGTLPLLVVIRIVVDALGSHSGSIDTTCRGEVYIDGSELLPTTETPTTDINNFVMNSRQFLLTTGQQLVVKVRGASVDTDINLVVELIDVTYLTREELNTSIKQSTDEALQSLEDRVAQSISELDISVNPERVILGPCRRSVSEIPAFTRQPVSYTPPFRRN